MVGKHLILDIHDVKNTKLLYDIVAIEKVLSEAAIMCGATILSAKFHEFGEGCGITGVLVLAESHISVHSWLETNFIAIDIFMCGKCNPMDSFDFIIKEFGSDNYKSTVFDRGVQ